MIKKNRRSVDLIRPKKVVTVSFAAEKGYRALGVLSGNTHNLGRSGMIIDLALIYNDYKKKYKLEKHTDEEILKKLRFDLGINE